MKKILHFRIMLIALLFTSPLAFSQVTNGSVYNMEVHFLQGYLDDGSEILSATTIGILEKRLQGYSFFLSHKSVIINLKFVFDFET